MPVCVKWGGGGGGVRTHFCKLIKNRIHGSKKKVYGVKSQAILSCQVKVPKFTQTQY